MRLAQFVKFLALNWMSGEEVVEIRINPEIVAYLQDAGKTKTLQPLTHVMFVGGGGETVVGTPDDVEQRLRKE